MIVIDPYSREPIYAQVVRRFTELIMVGALQNGEQLPSVRTLARELGVNPNTIQKAYADLERNHMIYTVSGKGNFVGEQETVARRVRQQLLEEVRRTVRAAYNNGIEYQEILRLIEQVYQQEGGKRDD